MVKKILIVDDNVELRKLVTITLDYPQFELSQSISADNALQIITDKSKQPDLIILDIMMPGKFNGLQLCEYIKKNRNISRLKLFY